MLVSENTNKRVLYSHTVPVSYHYKASPGTENKSNENVHQTSGQRARLSGGPVPTGEGSFPGELQEGRGSVGPGLCCPGWEGGGGPVVLSGGPGLHRGHHPADLELHQEPHCSGRSHAGGQVGLTPDCCVQSDDDYEL